MCFSSISDFLQVNFLQPDRLKLQAMQCHLVGTTHQMLGTALWRGLCGKEKVTTGEK